MSINTPPDRDRPFIDCIRCDGTGEHVECADDLCQAHGHCIHSPENDVCALCDGHGKITEELARRARNREPFGTITIPDRDLHARGRLHGVARARREGT